MKLIGEALYECSILSLDSGKCHNAENIIPAVDLQAKIISKIRGTKMNMAIISNVQTEIIEYYSSKNMLKGVLSNGQIL